MGIDALVPNNWYTVPTAEFKKELVCRNCYLFHELVNTKICIREVQLF